MNFTTEKSRNRKNIVQKENKKEKPYRRWFGLYWFGMYTNKRSPNMAKCRILSLSAVQIYDYLIYSCSLLHLRDKYELSIDQLPVGLIAQLVRALHRYRIGHGFPFKPEFFQVSFFSTAYVETPSRR